MSRGICQVCRQDRWLGGYQTCKVCRQPRSACDRCGHLGRIIARGLCYCCYQHEQVAEFLDDLAASFEAVSAYNQQLFDLYLRYVRRYRLQYCHKRQAEGLAGILSRDRWPTIRTWDDVYRLSRQYGLDHDNGKGNGCAVKKIGYMLQELGVLAAKDDDLRFLIRQALADLRPSIRDEATQFVAWLEKSGRAESTVVTNLKHLRWFDRWLEETHPSVEWAAVSQELLREHLRNLHAADHKPSRIRDALLTIRRFYRWLKGRRRVFCNPAAGIRPGPALKRLVVLSESEVRAVIRFVKDPKTDPEQAMLLTLTLFYGLKTEDLMHATIDKDGGVLLIVLRRRRRTRGRHYYNRNQTLKLPRTPRWFADLQDRFLDEWRGKYDKTKVTFPAKRLFLRRDGHSIRPLSCTILLCRFYDATKAAVGRRVPPNVLRQTCGNLHTRDGDASLLTILGWSPQFAFHYTWLPRELHT